MPEQDEAETQPQDNADPSDIAQPDVAQPDGAQPFQNEAEAGSSSEDTPQPVQVEPQAEPPRRLSRAEKENYERLRRRFAACGRCSYFLADCVIYLGEAAIQTAFLASKEEWVRLEGAQTFHRLLMNAYGVDLDANYRYYDVSCPECRRRIVCESLESDTLRLKIHV